MFFIGPPCTTQKRGFYGNERDSQNFKLPPFMLINHCETRFNEIINNPMMRSRINIQNISIFFHIDQKPVPRPHKVQFLQKVPIIFSALLFSFCSDIFTITFKVYCCDDQDMCNNEEQRLQKERKYRNKNRRSTGASRSQIFVRGNVLLLIFNFVFILIIKDQLNGT